MTITVVCVIRLDGLQMYKAVSFLTNCLTYSYQRSSTSTPCLSVYGFLFLHSRSLTTVYFFCTISFFFFCQHFKVLYLRQSTWPILTRLGHKYRLTIPFMSHDQIRVKGHVGVTGVKKVIFTNKRYFSYMIIGSWSCDFMYMHQLDPLYKSYVCLKDFTRGHLGSQGYKKVIFTN